MTDHHRLALASCYRSCLALAAEAGLIRTIAFCAISTGVFGDDDCEAYEAVLSPEEGHVEH